MGTIHDVYWLDYAIDFILTLTILYITLAVIFWVFRMLCYARIFCLIYDWSRNKLVVFCLSLILTLGAHVIFPIMDERVQTELTAKVVHKERVSYGKIVQEHFYLIYTLDSNGTPHVLANADNHMAGKHMSSDFYALLEIGNSYTFKCVGSRVPLFSKYPNIISFSKASN